MIRTVGHRVSGALRGAGRQHRELVYCWVLGWLGVMLPLVLPVAVLSWLRHGADRADAGTPGRGWVHLSAKVAESYRRAAGRLGGSPIPSPYLPDRTRRADPANRRDLLFLALEPFVAVVLLLVPSAMAWYGLFGLFAPGIARFFGGQDDTVPELLRQPYTALPAGLLLYCAALLLARPTSRLHCRQWLPRLLAPAPSVAAEVERRRLAERVAELTETRTAALDSREAELRRIERDLHDGAQARLVAIGLALGTVEALLDTDLEQARKLMRQARENSTRALTELRDLVRGIHPPVLAERGLVDALRALCLDAPLEAEVDAGGLTGRPEAPIEAALYFAVAELLTNAARHGDAARARIDLRHSGGRLRCTVWDDGRGGAHEEEGPVVGAGGSGLRGVRRRLAAFDGTLTVESPDGGPTLVSMELPCVLSSPKTSSSSAKDSATS